MEQVFRLDTAKLQKARKLDGGSLVAPARLTRVGILEYKNADGSIRRELRLPEEVFSQDSMATIAGSPVTIGHPGLVDANNWRGVSVGHVCDDVRKDGDFLASNLRIDDAQAVAQVEKGDLVEVSMGYLCDYDHTPGTWKGQHYDGQQKNIRYNHVALGPANWARAGNQARLTLDGKNYDVSLPYKGMDPKELQQLTERAVRAESELEQAKKRLDSLEGENTGLKARVTELEAQHQDAGDIDAMVEARSELVGTAHAVLGKDFSPKGKSNLQIKTAVVTKLAPKTRLDGKSEEFIDGMFAVLSSKAKSAKDETARAQVVLDTATAEDEDLVTEAQKRMAEKNRKAYDKDHS